MKKITVELMQHTPMIHFQVRYDQNQTLREQRGATLRASEVKPKLDRYLLLLLRLVFIKVIIQSFDYYPY